MILRRLRDQYVFYGSELLENTRGIFGGNLDGNLGANS